MAIAFLLAAGLLAVGATLLERTAPIAEEVGDAGSGDPVPVPQRRADRLGERRQVARLVLDGVIVRSLPASGTAELTAIGPGPGERSTRVLRLDDIETPFSLEVAHPVTELLIEVDCGDNADSARITRPAPGAHTDWALGSVVVGSAGRIELHLEIEELPEDLASALIGSTVIANVSPADGTAGGTFVRPAAFTCEITEERLVDAVVRHVMWTGSTGPYTVLWTIRPPLAKLPYVLTRDHVESMRADVAARESRLSVSTGQFVRGLVRDRGGNTIPGIVVNSGHLARYRQRVRTDEQGRFVFMCTPGDSGTASVGGGYPEQEWRSGDHLEFAMEVDSLIRLRVLTASGQPLERYGLGYGNVRTRLSNGSIGELQYRIRMNETPDGVVVLGRDRIVTGRRLFLLHPTIGERIITFESELIGRAEPYEVVLQDEPTTRDLQIVHRGGGEGILSLELEETSETERDSRITYLLGVPRDRTEWFARGIHPATYSYSARVDGAVIATGTVTVADDSGAVLHL